jgi:hypothetical protein
MSWKTEENGQFINALLSNYDRSCIKMQAHQDFPNEFKILIFYQEKWYKIWFRQEGGEISRDSLKLMSPVFFFCCLDESRVYSETLTHHIGQIMRESMTI